MHKALRPCIQHARDLLQKGGRRQIAAFAVAYKDRRVELRSDTHTQPTEAMRRAMYMAPVGDDCYNEDPTVSRLETYAASLLGKEAGMFSASGTMGNLLAIAAHCGRGDEVILGDQNHVYNYEGGGASCLLGVAFHPVPTLPNGTNRLEDLEDAIRPEGDFHFAKSRVVSLENTHNKANGSPLPVSFLRAVRDLCERRGLTMHIDGARLLNAAVALRTPAAELCKDADSVSVCLSKGLGAPIGTVVVGTRDFIKEAKRQRKVVGGGWRQAGVIAAAGLYALEHNVQRLAEDHANAQRLAQGLSQIPGISCDPSLFQTNLVYFDITGMPTTTLVKRLKEEYNVLIGSPYKGTRLRAVTSLMVNADDIAYTLRSVAEVMSQYGDGVYRPAEPAPVPVFEPRVMVQ